MPYLLNLVYLLLILFSAVAAVASHRKGKYREGYAAKFLGLVPRKSAEAKKLPLAARRQRRRSQSAGAAVETIEQERPEWECVISTTTTTGMALAKKKYPQETWSSTARWIFPGR